MDTLNDLCRACGIKKERLLNIHDAQESSKFIKSMLECCLQTTLTKESKYPKFICYDCLKHLEISYRFIKRFHLSQREFDESYDFLERYHGETTDVYISENTVEIHRDGELKKHITNKSEGSIAVCRSVSPANTIPIKIETSCKYNYNIEIGNSTQICSLCNKTFLTKKALNLHTKLSHKRKAFNI